ncbi:UNVERIFIED_CONTAM: hypothetical protein RMT77_009128 [Armadillidium vulgare]
MKNRIDQFQNTLTGDNALLINMQKEKDDVENEVQNLKEQHEKMQSCYQERKQVLEKLKRDIICSQLAIKDLKNKECRLNCKMEQQCDYQLDDDEFCDMDIKKSCQF